MSHPHGFMKKEQKVFNSPPFRYAASFFILLAALFFYFLLAKIAGGRPPTYVTFYPAVITIALIAGLPAGLFATITAAFLATYFLIPPVGEWSIRTTADAIGLGTFVFSCIFISVVAELYRRARYRSALLEKELALGQERARAEELLKEGEKKYRLIYESSLNGILISRPDGSIVSANRTAQFILGRTEEEIISVGGEGIADLSDPRMQSAIQERMRSGRSFGEVNFKKRDGSTFPVEYSSVTFEGKKGETLASVIFQDITARKDLERFLQASEKHYRELADAMPQLVWTATPEGKISYLNRRSKNYPDIKQTESSLWDCRSAVHPDDLPAVLEAGRKAIATQSETQLEHRLKDSTGEYRWYLSRGVPIGDEEGKVLRWIGTTTDIHDIKQAEQDLKERTRELEVANRELESFSYSVSHDLRAPLRAIDGFSAMLSKELDRLDENSRRKLQIVRDNVSKMDRLIDDLLKLSRSGRQHLNLSVIDMEELFNETWSEVCQGYPEGKATFRFQELKIKNALGDRALVKQAILNLLSNALKYARKEVPAEIEVGSSISDGSVLFWVRDNGTGFDMKYHEKLFGVFQRFHSESEYEGTGIGLAIVQRIIHRHGGRVWAEGKVGKGATFFFSLPKA